MLSPFPPKKKMKDVEEEDEDYLEELWEEEFEDEDWEEEWEEEDWEEEEDW